MVEPCDPRGYTGQVGWSARSVDVPVGALVPLLVWSSATPNRPTRVQVMVANADNATANQQVDALDPAVFLSVNYTLGQAIYQVPVDLRPGGTVFGVLASGIRLLAQNNTIAGGGGALRLSVSMIENVPEAPPATRTIVASIPVPIGAGLVIPVPQRARFVTVMPSIVDTYAMRWIDGNGATIGGFNVPMAAGQPVPIVVPAGASQLVVVTNPSGAQVPTSFVFELDL